MNKEELRIKYKKVRESITSEIKKNYDKNIFNKIIKLEEYKNSNLILVYVSLKHEIDTIELIKYSLNKGKQIAVPKCVDNNIKFVKIDSLNQLETGAFEILEPIINNYIRIFDNSICIIPGIAFDKENNRIGYGKGYYDRFLKDYKGIKIGLGYANCICDKINCETNDIKMDKIITN